MKDRAWIYVEGKTDLAFIQDCLRGLHQPYETDVHQMIYAYRQVYLEKKERQSGPFEDSDAHLWMLGPDVPALSPLYNFLRPFFA